MALIMAMVIATTVMVIIGLLRVKPSWINLVIVISGVVWALSTIAALKYNTIVYGMLMIFTSFVFPPLLLFKIWNYMNSNGGNK